MTITGEAVAHAAATFAHFSKAGGLGGRDQGTELVNLPVPAAGGDAGAHPASPGFGVRSHWVDRLVVVAVAGEVDALTAPRLTAAIDEVVASSPAGLIVDLSQVRFLAAAGLSVLLDTCEQLGPNVGFGVVAHGAPARRPITVLGLDGLLNLHRTVADAVRYLGGG